MSEGIKLKSYGYYLTGSDNKLWLNEKFSTIGILGLNIKSSFVKPIKAIGADDYSAPCSLNSKS